MKNVGVPDKVYNWSVVRKLQNGKYLCECICGSGITKEFTEYSLKHKNIAHGCEKCTPTKPVGAKAEFKVGQKFGYWEVISLNTSKPTHVRCRCTCGNCGGTEKEINIYTLRDGKSKSCGKSAERNQDNIIDMKDMTFGMLKVVRRATKDEPGEWVCECECGGIKYAQRSHLLDGRAWRCDRHRDTGFIDLTNKKFGRLTAKKYLGDKKWLCECSCTPGRTVEVLGANLRNGSTKSCGCLAEEYSSIAEQEVASLFPGAKRCVRDIIPPFELDIYIPEKKLAVEFNGSYWHGDNLKESTYHQKKSRACIDKGIRLIHIFEYEWNDEVTREKLKGLLGLKQRRTIYARNTIVGKVSIEQTNKFLDTYHLQNHCSGVEVSIGLADKSTGEILGLMTFGKPRFDNSIQYELLRMCWRDDVNVVGGKEKIFNTFIECAKPESIISYCNIGKFSGKSYFDLGFKYERLTEPNYVWCKDNDIKTRYQTMKKDLVRKGLGNKTETESEIMRRLGYHKIYDSGNAVYVWRNT